MKLFLDPPLIEPDFELTDSGLAVVQLYKGLLEEKGSILIKFQIKLP